MDIFTFGHFGTLFFSVHLIQRTDMSLCSLHISQTWIVFIPCKTSEKPIHFKTHFVSLSHLELD